MFIVEERRPRAPRQSQRNSWLTSTLAQAVELVEDLAEGDALLAAALGSHEVRMEGELTGETVVLAWGPVS
jgi:hypothetical protein